MEIRFCLAWMKNSASPQKAFKLHAAGSLFLEYVSRISKFVPCRTAKVALEEKKPAGTKIWLCDRSRGLKTLSSEELAGELQKIMDQGTRRLDIVVGGADGFSQTEIEELKPDLKWSFGPMTLPHELAAVVASEQIYRAFAIIRKLPYHSGH